MHRGKQFGNFVTCPKVFYKVGLKVIFDAVTLKYAGVPQHIGIFRRHQKTQITNDHVLCLVCLKVCDCVCLALKKKKKVLSGDVCVL